MSLESTHIVLEPGRLRKLRGLLKKTGASFNALDDWVSDSVGEGIEVVVSLVTNNTLRIQACSKRRDGSYFFITGHAQKQALLKTGILGPLTHNP